MYKLVLIVFLLMVSSLGLAAAEQKNFVKVVDPYIEMHTGPGRGYPIFYVAERGEWVEILFRQTDWFKVRTHDEKEGWVSANQLKMTLEPSGQRVAIKDPGEEDFRTRRWEYGGEVGDFSGASVIGFYAAYHFTENISTELWLSQVIGSASSSIVGGMEIVEEPFPDWKISPFIALGTGWIHTKPKSTLVQPKDRTNQFAHYGLGVRMQLTKRLLLRLEYRRYSIFTSQTHNEDINEWKAGFGFFF